MITFSKTFVTRTLLEVSSMDMCPTVRFGKHFKRSTRFWPEISVKSDCPCASVECPTRVLRQNDEFE